MVTMPAVPPYSSNTIATDKFDWRNSVNKSSQNYVVYSFVDKQGYSNFGSYTGNGNANGMFV